MLPISTLPSPKEEENTYPSLPKYYSLIKTGLENGSKNGPKMVQKNCPKNSPIVQGSIGPVHILPYASLSCTKGLTVPLSRLLTISKGGLLN